MSVGRTKVVDVRQTKKGLWSDHVGLLLCKRAEGWQPRQPSPLYEQLRAYLVHTQTAFRTIPPSDRIRALSPDKRKAQIRQQLNRSGSVNARLPADLDVTRREQSKKPIALAPDWTGPGRALDMVTSSVTDPKDLQWN
jgi:hypothetical protein